MELHTHSSHAHVSPAAQGFFMPAEWEKHEGTILSWPHNETTWPGMKEEIEQIWVQMIAALSEDEKVFLLVNDKCEEDYVIDVLRKSPCVLQNVRFLLIPTVDAWLRDSGPIFVLNKIKKERAAVNWIFNAWGAKYDDLMEDKVMGGKISALLGVQSFSPGIVLEGGSIDVNGKGTLLTTEQCLLNKNRNPQLSRAEIEVYLKNFLGVMKIVWLKEGIVGDDTDGHVDDLARFVDEKTVVCMVEDDKNDENYAHLRENYELLKKSVDQDGKPLTVIPLPTPGFVGDDEGRLPASYMNFYIGNKVVLVPVFGHQNDEKALAVLRRFFPERKVVGIACAALVAGFGGIHCVTQQVPVIDR